MVGWETIKKVGGAAMRLRIMEHLDGIVVVYSVMEAWEGEEYGETMIATFLSKEDAELFLQAKRLFLLSLPKR